MRSLIVSLFVLLAPLPASADRLPRTVTPSHYTLWFAPDFETNTFRARETIEVTLAEPAASVTLHAAEIRFDEVTITAGGRTATARVTEDAAQETVTFTVAERLPAGRAEIGVRFLGRLNDQLRGFYLSTSNGRKYAVSQMEATDARRAFPCFDEPAFKATFDVTLMVDRGDMAIANGAQVSDEPGPEPGKHTVTFARTQTMSSYLVAMLVGRFQCRSGNADGVAVRVCSTPEKFDLTGFALEATEQEMTYFNAYYGVRYPFGKLDIIAVPDFAAGAMENTGAIFFREADLLVDPERASLATRKAVASVIAHEMAHQWFGDLVTMRWWDDVWLNEGFATWAANQPLIAWKPEWHNELDEAEETQTALSMDALATTRAIRTAVETPDEINQVFDVIAYEKGASVLRMIEQYVGPPVFRAGVTSYLKKYAFRNASSEDFWNEIAAVSGKPVDAVMRGFVTAPGAPLVTARAQCANDQTAVSLSQERFTANAGAAAPSGQTWQVPVCLKGATGAATCTLLTDREQRVLMPGCALPVFINAGARGYYWSGYDEATLSAFAKEATTRLSPSERVMLLGDEWALARAGRTDITRVVQLVSGLAADPTPAVLLQLRARLDYVAQAMHGTATEAPFRAWVRTQFGPALAAVGLRSGTGEPDDVRDRRATLARIVGDTGRDPQVLQQARALADRFVRDPSTLDATVAPIVLRLAAIGGDAALYDRYLAALAAARAPDTYRMYLDALAWFTTPEIVGRALEYAISPDVRTQDAPLLLAGLLARADSRDMAWAFLKQNWPRIVDRLGIFQGVPGVVGGLSGFCSAEAAADIRAFFETHPVPAASRGIRQALERIDGCTAFRARQEGSLAAAVAAR